MGQGVEKGVELISNLLNEILSPEQSTIVLLETMAGKGSETGGSFEELAAVIERVRLQDKIGVCLDTCHAHDAGYDIINGLDGVLDEFDRGDRPGPAQSHTHKRQQKPARSGEGSSRQNRGRLYRKRCFRTYAYSSETAGDFRLYWRLRRKISGDTAVR